MGKLYERAEIYDFWDNEERYQALKKHWEAVLEDTEVHSFLDVSIGSGSTTLPLSELGVSIDGSDLSKEMLQSCAKKAQRRQIEIGLTCGDFREAAMIHKKQYDCVGSTGNSLPYVTNQEVLDTLGQMTRLVKPGGYLYLDIRNWDQILRTHQRFYTYNPIFRDETRVNLIQVWDYNSDGTMTFHLLYTFEENNKIVQKEHFEEVYYPISKQLILQELNRLGYLEIKEMCYPAFFKNQDLEQAEWYCILAKKPE